MKLIWKIEDADIQKVRLFYEKYENSLFVQQRIDKNINRASQEITKETFWKTLVACLLSTQQRSGPYSAVTKFLCTEPFPLAYSLCLHQKDLQSFAEKKITEFGGIRRSAKIAEAVSENFTWLVEGGWDKVFDKMRSLKDEKTTQTERQAARFIDRMLKGFGPKQSRNLLQSLGLTRYEIPVDSRITVYFVGRKKEGRVVC